MEFYEKLLKEYLGGDSDIALLQRPPHFNTEGERTSVGLSRGYSGAPPDSSALSFSSMAARLAYSSRTRWKQRRR